MMHPMILRRRRISGSGGGGADAYAIGGASPELVAAFTTQSDGTTAGEYYRKASSETTFSGLFTFSRSGTATHFDSNGTLQTAADGVARTQAYRYNSGWTLAGMQMEAAAATNLFDYSTDFSNAAWAKTRGAISSDAATGLDGNTGNFLFTCNTTSGLGAFLADTVSVSSGTRYCFWAVLEYSNVQWIHLRVNDGSAIGGWFDIQNGATGSTTGSETNGIGIVPIGSGKYLCYVDFTPNATTSATFYAWIAAGGDGTLNCVSGDAFYCYHMQMEVGSVPSSPIITTGSTVTRAAETLSIAGADTPANTTAMSVSMKGLMTYADNGAAAQETFLRWYADANNYITLDLDTDSTATGEVNANQSTAGTLDTVVAGAEYSPGVNVAFNIASRHTSGAVNVAKDGTAATADTTPTALADLSSTTLQMGQAFNGYISEFRMWGADIGDTGIAEVTS